MMLARWRLRGCGFASWLLFRFSAELSRLAAVRDFSRTKFLYDWPFVGARCAWLLELGGVVVELGGVEVEVLGGVFVEVLGGVWVMELGGVAGVASVMEMRGDSSMEMTGGASTETEGI